MCCWSSFQSPGFLTSTIGIKTRLLHVRATVGVEVHCPFSDRGRSVCFLSIIPLEKLFDWCGDQMTLFLGSSLGDLLTISLNNAVEATLAIILLTKCE